MNPAHRAAAAPPLIELCGVTRTYGSGAAAFQALAGVDLRIDAGEFVAVMGPSGSGKSTLMNLIGCLDRPTSGAYYLEGQDVAQLDRDALAGVRLRTLGFVFQGFNLLSRTTALENVELPLLYAGMKSQERAERAKDALRRVGLDARAGHTPNQLSGGQQQRVAIARALVTRPKLLLADEPTGNLDSRTSIEVMALLQELNGEGLTVLLVTHEPDIASYAGRLLLVKDGRLRTDEKRKALSAKQALSEWRDEETLQ